MNILNYTPHVVSLIDADGRVRKDGFNWLATQSELDGIESDLIDAVHRLFDYLRKK